jgi:hypothetical protein
MAGNDYVLDFKVLQGDSEDAVGRVVMGRVGATCQLGILSVKEGRGSLGDISNREYLAGVTTHDGGFWYSGVRACDVSSVE